MTNDLSLGDKPFDVKQIDKSVDNTIVRVKGCMHCEWKNSTKCPNLGNFDWFNNIDLSTKMCDLRKNYLISLSPPIVSGMTWAEFQRGFNLNLAEKSRDECLQQLAEAHQHINLIQQKLNDSVDLEETKQLQKVLELDSRIVKSYENRVDSLTKTIINYQDQQVNRDTVKKVDVTQTRIKPSDVTKLIKGKVIEDEPGGDA